MAGDDDEATPPGWYRQPDDPTTLRWWDGADWTDDTMEAPPSAGGRAAKARAAKAAAGATSATERSAAPRRTRRDVMAEAEAVSERPATEPTGADGPASAVAAGPTDVLPPVEIVLEPVVEGDHATRSVFAPDPVPVVERTDPPRRRQGPTVVVVEGPDAAPPDEARRGSPARPQARGDQRRDPRPGPSSQARPGPRPARDPRADPRTDPRRGPRPSAPAAHREPRSRGERLATPSPAAAAIALRILVRAAVIAVVVGIGWFGFTKLRDADPGEAPTLAEKARTVEVDPDAPRLDQIVLTLADLPRGWSAQATDPGAEDICNGRIPRTVIEPTGIESAGFTQGDNEALVGNVVQEFVDDDTAKAFLDLTARVMDSCREYTDGESTVRLTPLSFPDLGDQSFVAEASGETVNGALHGAFVYLRNGNRVASVVLISVGAADVNLQLVEHLALLVDRRMNTPPALGDEDLPGSDPGSEVELPGE